MLLKTPVTIKNLTLHNRLVLAPMATGNCESNGEVSEALLTYYKEICDGGHIGLAITEHSYIHPQGKAGQGQISVADDARIPGLQRLVQVFHDCGTKAICQINHAGSGTNPEINGGWEPVAPSPVGHPMRPNVPCREMTLEEIKALPKLFADAAMRVKAAGFDGVEIHVCHAYLLNQFYSPMTNFRTDEYGGSPENRIRVIREVIRAVRAAVGEDYLIALRLGGSDYAEGGATIDDAVYAAKAFAEEGIDLLDLSGGMCTFRVPGRKYPGYFRDMSEAIKAEVDLPVILTGGVVRAAEAETLLQEGAGDLIGVGRAIFRDHRWAAKEMV